MPKPENSVAVVASTRDVRRSATSRRARRPCSWPATAAVPWPITTHARMIAAGQAWPPATAAAARSPTSALQQPVVARGSGPAASCGSCSAPRRSPSAGSAAPSPRSMSRVVISACTRSSSVDGQLRAVVGEAPDAVERRPRGRRRARGPALGCAASSGAGRRLAVHPQVRAGLLDQPVRLAGHDERVVGQADVERLAAAPQGQPAPGRAGRSTPRRWRPSPRTRRPCAGRPR